MVTEMKSNKFWLAVLGSTVIVFAALALFLMQSPVSQACIYSNGNLIERLDLSGIAEPYTITVDSGSGVNVITVERGRIRVSEADCPDGSCVRQGWISGGVTPIVCLPNRLLIALEGGSDANGIDAVVG